MLLQSISWGEYLVSIALGTVGYYVWWGRRYGVLIPKVENAVTSTGSVTTALIVATVGLLAPGMAHAQDGNAGITQANTMIRGYFDTGVTLMYAIGAVLGLIGAVKVYQKWSHGDHDTGKVAAAWFGSCIFLVVVATMIRQFFGL
jgi:hypothetical protein